MLALRDCGEVRAKVLWPLSKAAAKVHSVGKKASLQERKPAFNTALIPLAGIKAAIHEACLVFEQRPNPR